jgi:hypothetical protein
VHATAGVEVRAVDISLDGELRPAFTLETPWGTGRVQLGPWRPPGRERASGCCGALHLQVPFAEVIGGLDRAAGAVADGDLRTPTGPWCSTTPTTPTRRRWRPRCAGSPRSTPTVGGRGLGEMRELASTADEHARIGRLAAQLGIDPRGCSG